MAEEVIEQFVAARGRRSDGMAQRGTHLKRQALPQRWGFMRTKTAMAIFENRSQQLKRGHLTED